MSVPVRVTRGADAGVRQKQPTAAYWGRQALMLSAKSNDQKRIFVRFSSLAQQIRGRIVLSATLSGRVGSAAGNHTVEIAELTEAFSQRTTWNNQPAVRSAGQVSALSTAAAGQRWTIPVTAMVQRVASGTTHFGFRLTTPATTDRSYFAFESGDSWRLDIELAEDSDAAVSLTPDGGCVGLAKPTLVWAVDEGDPDGPADGTDSQAAYRVQMNTVQSSTGLTYDSGTVASPENQHVMADFSYSLPSGTLVYWRLQTLDGAGVWSEWSDWAEMTYRPYPTVSITSPTSLIYDPSPVVQATVSSAFVNYQWLVFAAGETAERYDSKRVAQTTSPISVTIPERFNGARVFPTVDGSYQLVLRVEDRADRVETPGDPGYVEAVRTITYGSGSAPAPVLGSVEQVGKSAPKVRLSWTASPTPDGFTVERDGLVAATLVTGDADLTQSGQTFTWDDTEAKPGFRSYRVRAVTNGQGGAQSNPVAVSVGLVGTWLVRDKVNGGQQVCFAGAAPSLERDDSVAEYDSLLGKQSLRITYQRRYPKGAWSPLLDNRDGDAALEDALAAVRALEKNPGEEVTLLWAETAIRARLDNLLLVAGNGDGGEEWRKNTRTHRVTCQVRQVGEV